MSQDISKILKEATNDLLTEETLKLITDAVDKKANEKTQLAVEAALVKQDEEYSSKLEKVLEAIDADHTAKLDKIVSRIDENHSQKFKQVLNVIDESHSKKLIKIVKLYENALHKEAGYFKNNLVEQISNFIELYIDKAIPLQQIQEATENTRSRKVISEVKRLIGLSDEFINENIKEALVDGKQQIDSANNRAKEVEKRLKLVSEKAENLEKRVYLENKLVNFPAAKREYMLRVLSEKKIDVIKENFNYVSDMFDKQEQEEVENLKVSAKAKTRNVDITAPQEILNENKTYSSGNEDEGADYVAKAYVTEFTKKNY